jgi:hypothetical protein
VSSNFFAALSIPLVRGGVFRDGDGEAALPPAVVSDSLARALWRDRDPIGQLIDAGGSHPSRVVGVAADVPTWSRQGDRVIYLPRAARTVGDALLIRVDDDVRRVEAEVRGIVTRLDPQLTAELQTLTSIRIALGSKFLRIVWMVLFLGVVALALAMIGIYGVVAFAVGRRTREMGIRAALGATRRDILGLVFASSAKPVLAGAAVGLTFAVIAAQALGRVFRNAPVPIDPRDPLTYGAVTAIVLGVAAAAILEPARRAASADPSQALRQD